MCINNKIIEQLHLNEKQFSDLQEKYALIEPIASDYTKPEEKKELRIAAQINLGIGERALRQYVRDFKEKGIAGILRKRRNDKGQLRLFSEKLLTRAKDLLKENPYRSVRMLVKLLRLDPDYKESAEKIKPVTLYYHLRKSGYNFKYRYGTVAQKVYRKFEAEYANALWQGDARHGIEVEHPEQAGKKKRVYLFAWIDDYSRKIIFAKYYFDEKVLSLEDSFRQAVLRFGIPCKIYVDNGSAYISKQFTIASDSIGTRKIHHPPYQAYCKGKMEIDMKKIKRFQEEAVCAGIKTIDELNQTLWSWIEIEHNQKKHTSTGETPDERYAKSVQKCHPKRITNLEEFNACFLWRESRNVSKYGTISLNKNSYKIKDIGIGEMVEVLFDPSNLRKIFIYYLGKYHSTVESYKFSREQWNCIPEEKKQSEREISSAAKRYFEDIRKKHFEQKADDSDLPFSNIIKE
ncbi:DDE-type integrase/transposase/recombinase [bacterium]|nr:DDE-type integrase/transposase/recombinase [bacterium]